jgi:cold shock CspA family protein
MTRCRKARSNGSIPRKVTGLSSRMMGQGMFLFTSRERAGLSDLNEGQKVSFDLEQGQQGKTSATNLKVV